MQGLRSAGAAVTQGTAGESACPADTTHTLTDQQELSGKDPDLHVQLHLVGGSFPPP